MVYICQPAEQQPPGAVGEDGQPPKPKDYFFLSLLSLLCCCAPLGIVAVIKSLEVCLSRYDCCFMGTVKHAF